MKQVFGLFLVCAILGQASVRTLWVLDYQWNRAMYIARCENRDQPDLHCDGKCYLKKQMTVQKQAREQEPRLPESFHQLKDIQLFFEEINTWQRRYALAGDRQDFPEYRAECLPSHTLRIFKPPARRT
ncbi:MAG: hypothetical protein KDC65_16305 [Saprospiraceae bacterium]|nr:hypothetical protein [Saprospiraceae bacterium]